RAPLQRVDAAGGSPQPLTTLNANRNENSHRWPHFLPDGRSFLFTARSDVLANNLVYVSSLDSNELTPILSAQSNAVYVTPGYLLFAQEGTLLAQAFDARLKALSGEAFPVIPRISHSTPSSSAAFAASAEMLTYTVADPRQPRLAWLDRAGTVEQWIGEQWARPDTVDLRDIRLAPGETRAALVTTNSISGNRDIQLLHFATNNLTRFTSHGANDWWPTWSPDGRRLAFATDREGKSTVYVKNTSGGDESRLLHVPDRGTFPKDWSPDGRMISLNIDTPDGVASIWAARVEGDRTPFPLNQSDVRETNAMFSPDGRWVVYESAESGANEIYVKPIDRADKIRLSQAGGFAPRWPRQAREIIYRTPNGDVMSVALKDGRPDAPAPAVRLFSGCGSSLPLAGIPINYDVTPNATRFLMACPPDDARPEVVTVALHWTSSLRAR
ncbi:MAG: TolB family protein, partial [Acidobacteriota bacterium]